MSILYAYDSLNRFGIFNCLLIKVNSNIFFLFVIITDLSKQGTDPNFSGMLTPLCFYFAPPENIRKPLAFQCFQEVQNGNIDHKWVKEVDRNNSNLPMIVNSIHVFKSRYSQSLIIRNSSVFLNITVEKSHRRHAIMIPKQNYNLALCTKCMTTGPSNKYQAGIFISTFDLFRRLQLVFV